MSPSARRLSSTVATGRFAWQAELAAAPEPPSVVPMLRTAPTSSTPSVTPALRDLPSPAAERMETLERDAYARGYADGQSAGEATAAARLEDVTTRLAAAIADLAAVRGVLMRRAERDLVRLAVSMAERVLRHEIDVDRERLVAMARVAIDRLGEHAAATIHLNPVDYEVVQTRHAIDLGKSVELVADPSVARGGCLVRSSFGTIDAGIESQVQELSRALLGDDADEAREGLDGTAARA
jgi:flagellar assembly protein FliH